MKSFRKKVVYKFLYAFQGLFHGILHDRSIQIQACIACLVVLFGLILSLNAFEWLVVITMILMVLAAEFVNSAIEEICDALYPNYDQRAKKIKDYAAAFVLLISIMAGIIGVYILGGHMI